MKHLTKTFALLALVLALGAGACGGKSDACAALNKKLCAGKDDATCKKTRAWLDGELTDEGKKMSASEAGQVCKMILEDKESLAAYVRQAAEKAQ